MTTTESRTPPDEGVPAVGALDDVARLAAEAAAAGRADFDAFFHPGPARRPAEIVIGVPTW